MVINVDLWQVVLALLAMVATWTITLIKAYGWLNDKFSSFQPASEYDKRHQDLEKRVYRLELWKASKEPRGDWKESEPPK